MLKVVEKLFVFLSFHFDFNWAVEKPPKNTLFVLIKLLTLFNTEFSTITQQFVENLVGYMVNHFIVFGDICRYLQTILHFRKNNGIILLVITNYS